MKFVKLLFWNLTVSFNLNLLNFEKWPLNFNKIHYILLNALSSETTLISILTDLGCVNENEKENYKGREWKSQIDGRSVEY